MLERRNGAGASVKGINFEGKIAPLFPLQLQFGFTVQKSTYKNPESWSRNKNILPQKRMFRSPDRYGYVNLNYNFKDFSAALFGTYTGPMLVQHFKGYISEDAEYVTPDFYDLGLKLSYNFKVLRNTILQLNGGIQNIFNSYQKDFDKGAFRDAGYNYGPTLPRTPFVGIKMTI